MEICAQNACYICSMKQVWLIVFLIPSILFIGCDVVQKTDGIVLDKNSRLPLKGVSVGQSNPDGSVTEFYDSDVQHTDSNGQFHYNNIGGSGYFDLYFYKPCYQTQKVKCSTEHGTDTVFMVKTCK